MGTSTLVPNPSAERLVPRSPAALEATSPLFHTKLGICQAKKTRLLTELSTPRAPSRHPSFPQHHPWFPTHQLSTSEPSPSPSSPLTHCRMPPPKWSGSAENSATASPSISSSPLDLTGSIAAQARTPTSSHSLSPLTSPTKRAKQKSRICMWHLSCSKNEVQ